jgi:hypothetical protein
MIIRFKLSKHVQADKLAITCYSRRVKFWIIFSTKFKQNRNDSNWPKIAENACVLDFEVLILPSHNRKKWQKFLKL